MQWTDFSSEPPTWSPKNNQCTIHMKLLCGLVALVHINKVTLLSQVSNEMEFNGDNGFIVLVCNQPPRSTQPPTLSEVENEYQPKFSDILCDWLLKASIAHCTYGLHARVAGRNVWSLVNAWYTHVPYRSLSSVRHYTNLQTLASSEPVFSHCYLCYAAIQNPLLKGHMVGN